MLYWFMFLRRMSVLPHVGWRRQATRGWRDSLAGLRGEGGAQLLQVGGVHVGNGPKLQSPLTPTQQVVAVMARVGRNGIALGRRPHKHVDDVLPSFIDD